MNYLRYFSCYCCPYNSRRTKALKPDQTDTALISTIKKSICIMFKKQEGLAASWLAGYLFNSMPFYSGMKCSSARRIFVTEIIKGNKGDSLPRAR